MGRFYFSLHHSSSLQTWMSRHQSNRFHQIKFIWSIDSKIGKPKKHSIAAYRGPLLPLLFASYFSALCLLLIDINPTLGRDPFTGASRSSSQCRVWEEGKLMRPIISHGKNYTLHSYVIVLCNHRLRHGPEACLCSIRHNSKSTTSRTAGNQQGVVYGVQWSNTLGDCSGFPTTVTCKVAWDISSHVLYRTGMPGCMYVHNYVLESPVAELRVLFPS